MDDEDALLAADLAGDAGDDMAELVAAGAEDEQDDEDMDDEEDDGEAENDDAACEEADGAGDDHGAAEPVAAATQPKRRGKPKDLDAPKRPLLPYHQHGAAERLRLKESNPEILRDLKAIGKAMAESWE